jgi:hypothetical protein
MYNRKAQKGHFNRKNTPKTNKPTTTEVKCTKEKPFTALKHLHNILGQYGQHWLFYVNTCHNQNKSICFC